MKHARSSESGSALFLIFIGVMLFASLGYVVADMMRSGNANKVGEDRAQLFAGEVLDRARQIRNAMQDMKISNNCENEDISFEANALSGYTHTPAATDNCKVFHPSGGDISFFAPPNDWLDSAFSSADLYGEYFFPADLCALNQGAGGAGCEADGLDNEDLVLIIPYLNEIVCTAINEILGLGSAIPVETDNGWKVTTGSVIKFQDTFADGEILDQTNVAGCFAGSGTNTPPANSYHFYQVLAGR